MHATQACAQPDNAQPHANAHWRYVPLTRLCHVGVAVFDSLRHSTALSNSTIRSNLFSIAYGRHSIADSLQVVKRAAQVQQGSTQCGDYCVAWLVAFAFGDDLDTISRTAFDQTQMRTHLCQCLALGRFQRFPNATSRQSVEFSSEVVVNLIR